MTPILAHVNVIDFSAQLAALRDPSLRDRPFVVAAPGARSVVLSPSRRARAEGIDSGWPVALAERAVPDLVVLAPDEAGAQALNTGIERIVRERAPGVQNDSGGHFWLDLTGTHRLFGAAQDNAARIRRSLARELGIDAVLSLATNKLVAKVLSRSIRPEGLAQVAAGDEGRFLAHQSVLLLPGVGPALSRLLVAAGLEEAGELAALDDEEVRALLGPRGIALRDAARGIDRRPLIEERLEEREIVRRLDFPVDALDMGMIRAGLRALCDDAGLALRREKLAATKLLVSIRHSDGLVRQASRRAGAKRRQADSRPLQADSWSLQAGAWGLQAEAWGLDRELFDAAATALEAALERRVRLRSLVLRVGGLVAAVEQYDLFAPPPQGLAPGTVATSYRDKAPVPTREPFPREREERLQKAVDHVREKWGLPFVQRASSLPAAFGCDAEAGKKALHA